jgi:hypothetical protein
MAKYDDLAEDGFGHWLAGFADGEGCFYLRIGHSRGGVVQNNFDMRFSLSQRADDEAILQSIVERTGIGRLYRVRPSNSRPIVRWEVHKQVDLCALIEIFDRFPLRARKRNDFAVWREAVLAYVALQRKSGAGAGGFDPSPFARAVVDLKEARTFKEAA